MKTTKMSGFLCQSPAATAVCMNGDPRSMIVARRHDRSNANDRTRLIDFKYARLAESRRLAIGDKRAVTVSSLAKRDRKPSKALNVASPPSSSSSTADQVFQVVVMRVSLHCQGCAGKVKKHLSKMEEASVGAFIRGYKEGECTTFFTDKLFHDPADHKKKHISELRNALRERNCPCSSPRIGWLKWLNYWVTSFSIDLESQRVTVMGHVSPVGVLESVSKVKRAEFWPPPSNESS